MAGKRRHSDRDAPRRPSSPRGERRVRLQPTLEDELLRLRPLRADDFDALYAAASDPAIWEQHPEPDRHEEAVFRPYFDSLLAAREAVVVVDRETGVVVGMSRFHGYDPEASEVEIGWTFLARSHWGGTYNRELKDLMLAHAFRFVRSVVFLVRSGEPAYRIVADTREGQVHRVNAGGRGRAPAGRLQVLRISAH